MTSFRTRIGALTTLVVLSACDNAATTREAGVVVDTLANGALHVRNSAEGAWALAGAEPWRLEEEIRIGRLEGEPEYTFGRVAAIIPAGDGGMWVLDGQAAELRLYQPDGQFVRSVGRSGSGPGEFGGINICSFMGPNGEIWIEDMTRRWQRFDLTGALLGEFRSTSNLGCGVRVTITGDRLLVVNTVAPTSPGGIRSSFYVEHRIDPSGALVAGDTFPTPTPPSPAMVTWRDSQGRPLRILYAPFTHRPQATPGPSGHFWVAPGGGAYTLVRTTLTGDTILVVERDFAPVTVPDSIRDRAIREFQPEGLTADGGFDVDRVSRFFPPFEYLTFATDGSLWLRRFVDDGRLAYDIFTSDGYFQGTIALPDNLAGMFVHAITPEHLYGTVTDELDVPYVVRVAIRREAE